MEKDMGMTNKQFNGFVRFIIKALVEVYDALPESEQKIKLNEVVEILQDTLEDTGN